MLSTLLFESPALQAVLDHAQRLGAEAGESGLLLLLAAAVALVGALVARLVRQLVLWILRVARFNSGIRGLLGEGSRPVRPEPAAAAAWACYWALIALTVTLAADALGLDLGHALGERLREVLPRVAAATLELVAGIALAMLLGGVTERVFESVGARGSRLRGQIVSTVLGAFTVLISLEQLGLAAQFTMALGITVVAALGLAVALAFGLGCRELARDFVVEYLRSLDHERTRRPE